MATTRDLITQWIHHQDQAKYHENESARLHKEIVAAMGKQAAEALGGAVESKVESTTVRHPRGAINLCVQKDGSIWLQGYWDGRQLHEIEGLPEGFRWATVENLNEKMAALLALSE